MHDPAETGIVIAGFGEREYLPSFYSAALRGRICGHLMSLNDVQVKITLTQPSHVQTFAQDEEARAYLSGVNSAVRDRIINFWTNWMHSAQENALSVAHSIDGISNEVAEKIGIAFFDHAHENVHSFFNEMQEHQDEVLLAPIWESIGFLPKDELAVVAESLVNLTSLKQRMSIHETQTVGGAIDVALISKGDGFVWLKRKHDFSAESNPSWALTHSGIIGNVGVRPRSTGRSGTGV